MELTSEVLQSAVEFSGWARLAIGIGWLLLFVASVLGAWRWRSPALILMAVGFGFLTLRLIAGVALWVLGPELPQGFLNQWVIWDMYLGLADAFFILMAAAGLLWLILGRSGPNQDSSRSR